MKCKDIPEVPLLWFILCCNRSGNHCGWKNHRVENVKNGMPEWTPKKLRLAKMRRLITRGMVSGCACGCDGRFKITEKGKEFLKNNFEPTNRLPNL